MAGGYDAYAVTALASILWVVFLYRTWAGSSKGLESVLQSQVALVGSVTLAVTCWIACRQRINGYSDLWDVAPRSRGTRRLHSTIVVGAAALAALLTVGVAALGVNAIGPPSGGPSWPLMLLLLVAICALATSGYLIGSVISGLGQSAAIFGPAAAAVLWFLWSGFASVIWPLNWKQWLGLLYASPLPAWKEYRPAVPLLQTLLCVGVVLVVMGLLIVSDLSVPGVILCTGGICVFAFAIYSLSQLHRSDLTKSLTPTSTTVGCSSGKPQVCTWKTEPAKLRDEFSKTVTRMYGGLESTGVPTRIAQEGILPDGAEGAGFIGDLPQDQATMYKDAAEQFILSNGCDHSDLEFSELRDLIDSVFGGLVARAQGRAVSDGDLASKLDKVAGLCG